MNEPMNIVIAINRAYIRYAYVMLKSLLIHNLSPVHVYVFHHDLISTDETIFQSLQDSHEVVFHFVHITDDFLPPAEALAANSWGIETYFRLLLTDLLPTDIDRALYIDSDMIVNGSLGDFYYQNLDDKKLAACNDFTSQPPFGDYRDETFADIITGDSVYFNAGFTLFDIKALRSNNNFATYMKLAKDLNYRIDFPDQDLLNYRHHKEVKICDAFEYNLYARRAFTDYGMHYQTVKDTVKIIHYATSKPWQGNCYHCDIEQLWWDYAKLTPFYAELMEEFVHQTMTDSTLIRYSMELNAENQQLYHIIEQYDMILKAKGIEL